MINETDLKATLRKKCEIHAISNNVYVCGIHDIWMYKQTVVTVRLCAAPK